jgi:hypothetical protein
MSSNHEAQTVYVSEQACRKAWLLLGWRCLTQTDMRRDCGQDMCERAGVGAVSFYTSHQ